MSDRMPKIIEGEGTTAKVRERQFAGECEVQADLIRLGVDREKELAGFIAFVRDEAKLRGIENPLVRIGDWVETPVRHRIAVEVY